MRGARSEPGLLQVADVEAEVADLKARGVDLEADDMPDADDGQNRHGRRRRDRLFKDTEGTSSR